MQFMKHQNSEDYEDPDPVLHCHVSDLESQEEAVVSMNQRCSTEDDNTDQIEQDEFDECLPNVIKNTDLVVSDSVQVLSDDAD